MAAHVITIWAQFHHWNTIINLYHHRHYQFSKCFFPLESDKMHSHVCMPDKLNDIIIIELKNFVNCFTGSCLPYVVVGLHCIDSRDKRQFEKCIIIIIIDGSVQVHDISMVKCTMCTCMNCDKMSRHKTLHRSDFISWNSIRWRCDLFTFRSERIIRKEKNDSWTVIAYTFQTHRNTSPFSHKLIFVVFIHKIKFNVPWNIFILFFRNIWQCHIVSSMKTLKGQRWTQLFKLF